MSTEGGFIRADW